jgi:hypothetical protein
MALGCLAELISPLKKEAALRDGASRLLRANGKGLRHIEKPLVLRSSVRSVSKPVLRLSKGMKGFSTGCYRCEANGGVSILDLHCSAKLCLLCGRSTERHINTIIPVDSSVRVCQPVSA